jgi:endo-alpha-1,4-polygalactosaminidase (GH114 family)
MYSAFIVIDITGGMGVTTARKLQQLGYRDLYVDGVDHFNKWKYDPKVNEKIPGINFNSKRVQIIASFEEGLRHGFKIYSSRLLNEMGTFIYVNGRPDHQKGHHDDLIMSISMCTYVCESSFSSISKVTQHTKAMLESWQVSTNTVKNSNHFNPIILDNKQANNQPTKNDYMNYNWLFGGYR